MIWVGNFVLFAIDRFAIWKVVGIENCDEEGLVDGDGDVDARACHGRWDCSWLGIFGFSFVNRSMIGKRKEPEIWKLLRGGIEIAAEIRHGRWDQILVDFSYWLS